MLPGWILHVCVNFLPAETWTWHVCNCTYVQCDFKSVFRSNCSLLIFSSLTAAGFGDLHLVAMSQQKVQPGDVKPRTGPRLLTQFWMASVALARESGTRPPRHGRGRLSV